MKRLRKSEISKLDMVLPVSLSKKDDVLLGDNVILVNNTFSFFKNDVSGWVPALPLLLQQPEILPKVVVDMGAVGFVTRGADVMRPGITDISDFSEGDLICVVDETHSKPLAVVRALMDSSSIRTVDSGKVLENLHYVGDDLWKQHQR